MRNCDSLPGLYSIPTDWIVTTSKFLVPTPWDLSTIQADLNHYVQTARVLACTPEVTEEVSGIVVVNGMPFVTAACNAKPIISPIICQSYSESINRNPKVTRVSPSQLLDAESRSSVVNMLFATLDVDAARQIEAILVKHIVPIVGPHPHLEVRAVTPEQSSLVWELPELDVMDRRLLALRRAVKTLSIKFPITSWNGIRMDVACK
jgi:hypothetical protein